MTYDEWKARDLADEDAARREYQPEEPPELEESMAEHAHFCPECRDCWEHVDEECDELEPFPHHVAFSRLSFDYECPQHAGSQEVSG